MIYALAILALTIIGGLMLTAARAAKNARDRMELEDRRRADAIREAANNARDNHPNDLDDTIDRLRDSGRLRDND